MFGVSYDVNIGCCFGFSDAEIVADVLEMAHTRTAHVQYLVRSHSTSSCSTYSTWYDPTILLWGRRRGGRAGDGCSDSQR